MTESSNPGVQARDVLEKYADFLKLGMEGWKKNVDQFNTTKEIIFAPLKDLDERITYLGLSDPEVQTSLTVYGEDIRKLLLVSTELSSFNLRHVIGCSADESDLPTWIVNTYTHLNDFSSRNTEDLTRARERNQTLLAIQKGYSSLLREVPMKPLPEGENGCSTFFKIEEAARLLGKDSVDNFLDLSGKFLAAVDEILLSQEYKISHASLKFLYENSMRIIKISVCHSCLATGDPNMKFRLETLDRLQAEEFVHLRNIHVGISMSPCGDGDSSCPKFSAETPSKCLPFFLFEYGCN